MHHTGIHVLTKMVVVRVDDTGHISLVWIVEKLSPLPTEAVLLLLDPRLHGMGINRGALQILRVPRIVENGNVRLSLLGSLLRLEVNHIRELIILIVTT